jgi:hypothetical protein
MDLTSHYAAKAITNYRASAASRVHIRTDKKESAAFLAGVRTFTNLTIYQYFDWCRTKLQYYRCLQICAKRNSVDTNIFYTGALVIQ